jgi:hypothetical protein
LSAASFISDVDGLVTRTSSSGSRPPMGGPDLV